jgi:hypothetical protein
MAQPEAMTPMGVSSRFPAVRRGAACFKRMDLKLNTSPTARILKRRWSTSAIGFTAQLLTVVDRTTLEPFFRFLYFMRPACDTADSKQSSLR